MPQILRAKKFRQGRMTPDYGVKVVDLLPNLNLIQNFFFFNLKVLIKVCSL